MRSALLLIGAMACGGTVALDSDTDGVTDTEDTAPEPVPDLSVAGPFAVATDTAEQEAGDGCTLSYTRYRPEGEDGAALVVLAHGFARSQQQMVGWARLWASWGVEVVTPDLCFLRLTRTDHPANGRTLAALADALAEGRPVVFAGHSAGGLAATLAGAERADSALFALDPVDNNDLGAAAVGARTAATAVLLAEPSTCNANGSGAAWAVPDAVGAWRVDGSDHCDFESPTNGLCTALCRRGEGDHEAINGIVAGMSTGFVLWQGGVDARGAEYWTAGDAAFETVSSGLSAP